MDNSDLLAALSEKFTLNTFTYKIVNNQCQMEFPVADLIETAVGLRDDLGFKQLMDITVVDLLDYGKSEWKTSSATSSGFSRGYFKNENARKSFISDDEHHKQIDRFVVVYHLLSIKNNCRLRLKIFLKNQRVMLVPSVVKIWSSANWYEREAFDLFGIHFSQHPDLRRILTDYGFIGHPFRKDFPLIGNVEVRYDPSVKRVVQKSVSIEPRVLVPKVIRRDGLENKNESKDESVTKENGDDKVKTKDKAI